MNFKIFPKVISKICSFWHHRVDVVRDLNAPDEVFGKCDNNREWSLSDAAPKIVSLEAAYATLYLREEKKLNKTKLLKRIFTMSS